MPSMRKSVVVAWLEEQFQAARMSTAELSEILNCLEAGKDLSPLIRVANRVGDATPIELLAAIGNHADTDSYCRRSRIGPGGA